MRKRKNKIYVFLVFIFFQTLNALQLGDGTQNDSLVFIKVLDDVKEVSCRQIDATYAIKNDNSLWGTGEGLFKDGSLISSDTFIKLMDDVKYYDGTYLVRTDDTLWEVPRERGKLKFIDTDVRKVSDGLYIKNDGDLYAYGKDYTGSFGIGEKKTFCSQPVFVRKFVSDVLRHLNGSQILLNDGQLFVSGNQNLPDPNNHLVKFRAFKKDVKALGGDFYITNDNVLFGYGYAGYGALGVGEKARENLFCYPVTKIMDDVKEVSTSRVATLILKTDGTLYGCGGDTPNYAGELGLGNLKKYWTPQYIMSGVVKISLGNQHSAIIKEDGSLWTCGANYNHGAL